MSSTFRSSTIRDIAFRKARDSDREAMKECMRCADSLMKASEVHQDTGRSLKKGDVTLVIYRGSDILGYIAVIPDPQGQHFEPRHWYIRRLFIHPNAQRMGVGSALMDWLDSQTQHQAINLKVHLGAQITGARAMFTKRGFVRVSYQSRESAGYYEFEHWLFRPRRT